MKRQQEIQEEEYAFPYHYIPQLTGDEFRQHAYWSWGFRYFGGMHVAKAICDEEPYVSLLDIGCGDGRFLSELAKQSPKLRLMGVDYSERAIALAKSLNPTLDYRVAHISSGGAGEKFDVVTLIEVLEHIPPDEVPSFVAEAVDFLRPGGRLILTVPHKNARVGPKHFQHFDSSALRTLLSPHLEGLRFQPFDYPSRLLKLWLAVLGRAGSYYIVTWRPLLNTFYRFYRRHCLYGTDESRCARIACVGRKPAT